MSQNRTDQQPPQQRGLQTTRPGQKQELQSAAVPVTGTLTRLPERGGSTANPSLATQWIDDAYEQTGLVAAPFGNSVPIMGPGYAVSATPVQVTDLNDGFDGTQIYPIKGSKTKKGLLKTVLDDLATGMGFDWPPQWTWEEKFGDDRDRDRLCQKITVCGRYKDVDGSWKTAAPQTKEIDLREGSSEVEEIRARHLAKQLYDLPRDATPVARAERERLAKLKADAELAQTRKFIRSHAQTKARLMVIGTKVRRSYTIEELRRGPIWCFRVIQTWRSDNPETQARFDQAIIDRELSSNRMLYGESPAGGAVAPRALPPVSDDPYPEQQDAGIASDISAPASDSAAGQGDAAGADPATVEGAQTSNQPELQHCTAESGCLGLELGRKHVMTCYGAQTAEPETTPQQPAQEQPEAWKITRGPAKGLAVNSGKVRPETLKELKALYLNLLDMNGPDFNELSEEKIDLLNGELREIVKELRRRGIKDDGS